MRPVRLLFVALLLGICVAHAADDGFQPNLTTVSTIPRYATDGASVAKALTQVAGSKSQPVQYAVAAELPLRLSDGEWTNLDAATDAWRIRVASPGALSLSAEFSRYHMPEGGSLWIYDKAGTLVQGPYTASNNSAVGKLWTAMVRSDEAVLEVHVPAAKRSELQLELGGLMHGYLDFTKSVPGGSAAGSCEINTMCTQGDNWRNEISSVGAYTTRTGNTGVICTGQLVNDIRQDGTPYFLTANHCQVNSATVASSMVVYWNYQASACNGTTGSLSQNQTGSVLIAGDVGSDFTLVRLNAKPNSGYNLYYAGFDASGAGATSGVGIHHPGGDIKKISTFSTSVTQQSVMFDAEGSSPARTVQAWQVGWASGVTEPGSSGSGLWNQNHQIIGVLSGGDSSCSTPAGNDYYGRLDLAWTASASACSQLKATLDPANSGQRSVAGAAASALGTGVTTTPNCSVSSGSGGGGAVSPMLLLLLGPLAWRRRRRH